MKGIAGIGCAAVLAALLCATAGAQTIVVEGSTTVFPIAQKAAEVYMAKNPAVKITVRGGGSGVGIASLIDGTIQIAASSRYIKTNEIAKAQGKGVNPKGTVVAMDGLAIIVNPANEVSDLTREQVKAIYTGAISDWKRVGGKAGKIVVVSRDTASGTYEAFGELVLDKQKVRPDALTQASNQAVATVVSKTPGAIGYVGLGYLSSAVKAVAIEGVQPSAQAVLANKYPVSRPLFLYTNGAPQGEVKKFIDFILSTEGQQIVESVGFVKMK